MPHAFHISLPHLFRHVYPLNTAVPCGELELKICREHDPDVLL